MDKLVALLTFNFSSGQNGCTFLNVKKVYFLIFVLSIETEIGSAGEQPNRDKLMADKKRQN